MKRTVKIITDSTCDLPEHIVQEYRIGVVPLRLCLGGAEYMDGAGLKKEAFYEALNSSAELPTTSQPPLSDFEALYRKTGQGGCDEILSIHISSKMSGTLSAAKMAAEAVQAEGLRVELIDSKTVSMGLGFLVRDAARLASAGQALSQIKGEVFTSAQKTKLYFAPHSLQYLQKGGRISRLKAIAGDLARVIPILAIKDGCGEVECVKRCRREKVVNELVSAVLYESKSNRINSLSILYSPPPYQLERFESGLRASFPHLILEKVMVGCVIGSHVGPSALGVAIQV